MANTKVLGQTLTSGEESGKVWVEDGKATGKVWIKVKKEGRKV